MTTTSTVLGRRTLLTGAAAMFGLAQAPRAFAQAPLAGLEIVDRETDRILPIWTQQGRWYVAGETGKRYGLRLRNYTSGRLELVLSVDGVNVVTGQTADPRQIGYVLAPHAMYDVTGWRKSDTEVAAFTFSSLPDSYAARTGRPADVGVIGLAAFQEKTSVTEPVGVQTYPSPRAQAAPPPPPPVARRSAPPADIAPPPPLALPPVEKPIAAPPSSAPPPPSAAAAPSATSAFAQSERRSEKLGTAHGELEWSQIHHVRFDRATAHAKLLQQIEYDSYANLAARGVVPAPSRSEPHPRPFPGDGRHYVPDPPND